MSVNYEIKGMLAKLLATEDIIVEHKHIETACFNVHTRVLTLPIWDASNAVVDLLISHECGHSLYTDDVDWTLDYKIPPHYVNVVEDARIEKLMKRRYAGLSKTFYIGYKELSDKDFFEISDDKLETYNLADRINLLFKIGNFIDVPIEPGKETEIYDSIGNAETFDQVLIAARELYNYCKQENIDKEKQESTKNTENNQKSNTSDNNSEDNQNGNEKKQQESDNSVSSSFEESSKTPEVSNIPHTENTEDPKVKTMESLEKGIKELANPTETETVYLELPKLNLTDIIVQNSDIHDACKETWDSYVLDHKKSSETVFGEIDKLFTDFKRSSQKEVGYLVKEFQCRKAADSYARSITARTGILDCSKIYNYKYNEDIFKKITTLSEGKNHGLVFILDWSGSMSQVMLDTVKQLFNLVWFCKKVSIPFEVYAFTTDYPLVSYDETGTASVRKLAYQKRDSLIQVSEWFSMMNLLTSKTNLKILENQMKNIFRIAHSFNRASCPEYSIPMGMSLSGTPLNEALIALHQILPKFKKDYKLQKVQCVILTDGEATAPKYHREIKRNWEGSPYIGISHIGSNAVIRDRKTGNTYSCNCEWWDFSNMLLRNLRDKFSDINFIGIRVLENRDATAFIRRYCTDNYDKIINVWKKQRAFSIKNSGFHNYFSISSSSLSQDSEFDVADNSTKVQIKNAFVKSLRSKKMNKKILGEFVELIV